MRAAIVPGLLAGLISLNAAPPSYAELPDLSDKQFVLMLVTVMSVDHLKPRCTGPSAQAALQQTQAWEAANDAALIRKAVIQVERSPSGKHLTNARSGIEGKLNQTGQAACTMLIATITLPDAQFAGARQLAAIRSEFGAAPATNAKADATPAPVRTAAMNKRMSEIAAKIEGFAFDYNMTMGIGGGMAMRVFPVVLFKDGQVLEDIEGLSFAGGLEAHKRANADDWSRWRRQGEKLQTQTSKGWENLPFTAIYSKLPDGFKLNGRFQSLGGGGNTAYGGSDFVAAWSTFDFLPDGRVVKGGGAGGYSAFQSASSAFSTVATDRRGKYRINGLTLDIAYDNGAAETYLIVTDPKDPDVIWLDGTSYTMKD